MCYVATLLAKAQNNNSSLLSGVKTPLENPWTVAVLPSGYIATDAMSLPLAEVVVINFIL